MYIIKMYFNSDLQIPLGLPRLLINVCIHYIIYILSGLLITFTCMHLFGLTFRELLVKCTSQKAMK